MLLKKSGEIAPEGMKRLSQWGNNTQVWRCLVVEVKSDAERIWLGTSWHVRFMNQGKLEVVKEEVARVNIDILGISELKWTGMGRFNSDDHDIYYCGQESIMKNGVALIVNKRV